MSAGGSPPKALPFREFLLVFLCLAAPPLLAQTVSGWIPLDTASSEFVRFSRLLTRVGELSGIQFQVRSDLSPQRAQFQLVRGELDAVIGLSRVLYQDLAGITPVAEPFIVGRHLVVAVHPFPYKDRRDLRGKSVLGLRGTASASALATDHDVIYVEAPDWRSGFQMLEAGRADVLVVHELFYRFFLSTNAPERVKLFVADQPYLTVENLIWFRPGLANLAPRVDKALKTLKSSGEYARILGP